MCMPSTECPLLVIQIVSCLQETADHCMLSDPHERPTFEGLVEILKALQVDMQATSDSDSALSPTPQQKAEL